MDSGRTICLEDIKSLKQQNNWCSWVVKVFAGCDGSNWKSCGVGILTFSGGGSFFNTFAELEAAIKDKEAPQVSQRGDGFRLTVKQ